MNTPPKALCTIICDDVRMEVSKKAALLGVYADRILFMKLPSKLPKLCFFTLVQGGEGQHAFSFHLLDPDGQEIEGARGEGQMKLAEDAEGDERANLAICLGNVGFEKAGRYRYKVSLAGSDSPLVDHHFNVAVEPSAFVEE